MTESLVLEKAVNFALRIVKLSGFLSEEKTGNVLGRQILPSGTRIAEFIKDAAQAESKNVFARDFQIAVKKATAHEFRLLIRRENGYLEEKPSLSIDEDRVESIKMPPAGVKTSKENA